ncbi:MAG TPA: lysylphosphatidylglycerol synthase transmembrane domain-containing protein [Kofleriaceae bacterium]
MLERWWWRWGWVVRWSGTALGVLYVARLIHPGKLAAAFSVVSLGAVLGSIAIVAAGIELGAVRWRIALRAYGARSQPGLLTASRLYFIAVFYNTFLPGAVAGDVVRGVATRDSFGEHGATGALAVVFVERLLGLFGVFALILAGIWLVGDALGDRSMWWGSLAGGAASLAALFLLPLGRRLGRFLPAPLARIAERLPVVVRPRDFAAAALLSLATQLAAVIAGWLVLRDLHPRITFGDALLILPVAAATAFLPITVGGTGAREAAFVFLCGRVLGMASDDAVAASLLIWLATLVIGAFGGLLALTGRGASDDQSKLRTASITRP